MGPEAGARPGRVTAGLEPRDKGRLGRLSDPEGLNKSEAPVSHMGHPHWFGAVRIYRCRIGGSPVLGPTPARA
jgi:hypothetical protein